MADDKQAADNTKNHNSKKEGNKEADSPAKSADLRSQAIRSGASFPIEGESKWVNTMRFLAVGTLLAILATGIIFQFMTEGDSFAEHKQLAIITGGIIFLLFLEYLVFLTVVIPKQADYGRFVIHRDQVEYFPLTKIGLGISSKSYAIKMNRYMGVLTGTLSDRKQKIRYAVYLVHMDEKGKTVMVQTFNSNEEAELFGASLGNALGLTAIAGT